MPKPKLILLHGFAGVGKTTIAERYINDRPLTMILEGDKVGAMLGRWLDHEKEARKLLYTLGKAMVTTYLETGHSVIVPMLPIHPEHVRAFELITKETDAQFFEVILVTDREEAVKRLLKRGTWGEAGAPPISKVDDMPMINQLYDGMQQTLAGRPNAIRIPSVEGAHDDTYQQFLAAIGE